MLRNSQHVLIPLLQMGKRQGFHRSLFRLMHRFHVHLPCGLFFREYLEFLFFGFETKCLYLQALVAHIVGGGGMEIGAGQILTLNGSTSRDPDVDPDHAQVAIV